MDILKYKKAIVALIGAVLLLIKNYYGFEFESDKVDIIVEFVFGVLIALGVFKVKNAA